jgi:hypothetical protein
MIVPVVGSIVIAGVLGLVVSDVRAAQQLTCPQIVAMKNFAGGKMTTDELAQKLNTDVETVRKCLDQKPPVAKTSPAPAAPTPPPAPTAPPAPAK